MEEEIDLRPYVRALIRYWWLVIGLTLIAAVAAYVVSSLLPPTYEATAGVVMLKSKAEISLGSGFQALTDDDLDFGETMQGNALIERTSRRQNSLVGMVGNGTIARQVVDELSDVLDEDERVPSRLMKGVEGVALEGSDTIQIVASFPDPDKAAAIANAWARAFVAHVNAIYGESSLNPFVDIDMQVDAARTEYDKAQESLLDFLAEENRVDELQRQVEEDEATIAALREGRQNDISEAVDSQVAVQKRLFNTSVVAEIDSNLRVFERQRDELLREFERAYSRKHRLEELLDDARLMREQLVAGEEASAGSTGLALLALKSSVFISKVRTVPDTVGLPFDTLDLQLPSVDALNSGASAAEQIADLDGLIAAIAEEVASLEDAIREQAVAFSSGEGYQFLVPLSSEYLDIADSQAVLALLRMADWEGLLSYSSLLDDPLSQEIARLEDHVRSLLADIARLGGVRADLAQDRDISWQAYSSLLAKEQEIRISAASEGTEVSIASTALPPPRSPAGSPSLMNTAVAGALGMMLGVSGVFAVEWWRGTGRESGKSMLGR